MFWILSGVWVAVPLCGSSHMFVQEPYHDVSTVTDELVDVLLSPLLTEGIPGSYNGYNTGPSINYGSYHDTGGASNLVSFRSGPEVLGGFSCMRVILKHTISQARLERAG